MTTGRKKLAVFDRFDWNPSKTCAHPTLDLNGEIDRDYHDVVAHANDMTNAALQLIAMKNGELPVPDVIIIDSILEDYDEYVNNPAIIASEVHAIKRVRHSRLMGLITLTLFEETTERRELYALPIVDLEGREYLPEVQPRDEHEDCSSRLCEYRIRDRYFDIRDEYIDRKIKSAGSMGGAGYALAHLANYLFNQDEKTVRLIGHSNYSRGTYGFNDPLDVYVNRRARPGVLRGAIDKLASHSS